MPRQMIAIETQEGKGSVSAHVMWFVNAIMQRRQIAYDGRVWYVAANNRARFKPISDCDVPGKVREEMTNLMSNG